MSLRAPLAEIKAAHRLLAEYAYQIHPVERGYANRTLHIDLSTNQITEQPVTDGMKRIFTGGRGFGMKLLWDAVSANTRWDDPENALVIAGGPIGGITAYPGSGKSTVVSLSPLTHTPFDSNVGGYFGPYLKFSGFDALAISGRAQNDVVIVIDGDDGQVSIEEAPLEELNTHLLTEQLTEMYARDERDRRSISVVSAGQGGDYVRYSSLNFSWFDTRRGKVRIKQAGRGGLGHVFRSKKIKGIVVIYRDLRGDSNNPVDLGLIRKAGKRINAEIVKFDDSQHQMRKIGTANLVEIMDHFDLLPTHNFRFGRHADAKKIDSSYWMKAFTQGQLDGCWAGCTMSCSHAVDHFTLTSGPYRGEQVIVDGPEYETIAAVGSNCGILDPAAILELNFYCDTYGIDTISFGNCIALVMECYQLGILNQEATGGLDLSWGNAETSLELLHQMARGEGFGHLVGQGVRAMKQHFVEHFNADAALLHDIGMEIKGLEVSEYMTKESLAQQGGYALASKGAQHDEAWLIFMDQVHNQIPTFADKAEALHYFPLWRTWFSLHGLCKLPWNDITPEGNSKTAEPNKFPEHVENYTWLYEGLTGNPVTSSELIAQSERVYNFQRVLNLRMGYGTREHDYPPYRAVGPVTIEEYESRSERYDKQLEELGLTIAGLPTTEKMSLLRKHRESRYEELVDAVYARRGWDQNGVPTLEKLKQLGIDLPEVVAVVKAVQA